MHTRILSFRFGTLRASLRKYKCSSDVLLDGVSILLEPRPVDQSSLYTIDHFPNLKLGR